MVKVKSLVAVILVSAASVGLVACKEKKAEEATAPAVEQVSGESIVVAQTPPDVMDEAPLEGVETEAEAEVEEKVVDEIENSDVQSDLNSLEIELKNKK